MSLEYLSGLVRIFIANSVSMIVNFLDPPLSSTGKAPNPVTSLKSHNFKSHFPKGGLRGITNSEISSQ